MKKIFILCTAFFSLCPCSSQTDAKQEKSDLTKKSVYQYKIDWQPTKNLPPAYGFCVIPKKEVVFYVMKQKLKNKKYRQNKDMYQRIFIKKCKSIKGKYIGGDSGVRQRYKTFQFIMQTIMQKISPEVAANLEKKVQFDRRYHTLARPGKEYDFKLDRWVDVTGYRPGNGQGLRFPGLTESQKKWPAFKIRIPIPKGAKPESKRSDRQNAQKKTKCLKK